MRRACCTKLPRKFIRNLGSMVSKQLAKSYHLSTRSEISSTLGSLCLLQGVTEFNKRSFAWTICGWSIILCETSLILVQSPGASSTTMIMFGHFRLCFKKIGTMLNVVHHVFVKGIPCSLTLNVFPNTRSFRVSSSREKAEEELLKWGRTQWVLLQWVRMILRTFCSFNKFP